MSDEQRTDAIPDETTERLDDLAEDLSRPHEDDAERARRQANAEEAGHNPRREGEGEHPGIQHGGHA
jgi:predicted transcriptional regulator